jgi:hypothetical protein
VVSSTLLLPLLELLLALLPVLLPVLLPLVLLPLLPVLLLLPLPLRARGALPPCERGRPGSVVQPSVAQRLRPGSQ